jgi:two-component system sensor histidine kinase/response regulator
MMERARHPLIGYGVALGATAISLLVRWPLWPVLGDSVPHMTFFPAVMIAAYIGGFWPGIVATILSAILANVFLTKQIPFFSFANINDVVALILFLLVGTIISALCESLHRVRGHLVAAERQRGEEARREAEERFRQVVENIQELFWITDAQSERILFVNPLFKATFGQTFETVAEQTSRAFPVYGGDGSLVRIAGLAEDISQRKEAEQSLRESEQRFRTFVDHATEAFFLHDEQFVVLDVNRQACESLGYTREELRGMTPLLFDPDMTAAGLAETDRGLSAGKIMAFESRHRRKDGVIFPVEIRGRAFWEGGRRFTVALARDITDRKRTEEALRESEQRWRSLTEALPQLVWTATPDGSCDYFSTQWTQHTGIPENELLGWHWLQTLHPDDREPTRRAWLAAVQGPGTYDVEYRVRRSNGEYRWFKTRGVPIWKSDGDIFKWFGTCTDITDGKRTEEELRQAKQAAESANRAKDEFLANVSHEIRTPMNAILGLTELVLGTRLEEGQRQSLTTVKSAANNLLGIINDLLDFSKIEAGKLELDHGEFSLRAALGDTLRALAVRAHQKGLELASNVHTNVPDALTGDAGRLRQVLLNIIGNAIKFTEKGEVVVQVSVVSDVQPAKDEVRLLFTVRDTGIGIPSEKHAAIFRAFEQEDSSTTRKFGGTGLGLTIAAQLVALMGGNITVESETGRGSTFRITARFGRSENDATLNGVVGPADLLEGQRVLIVDDNLTPATPLNILVAEDNEFNVTLLKQLFARKGHSATIAGDGREALALATAGSFDALLLDIHLPELDGFTVARAIRDQEQGGGKHLPIIAFTARSGKQDRERCLEAGMDDFLAKPVQAEELWAVIGRVVAANGRSDDRASGLIDPRALLAACGDDGAILASISEAFRARLPEHLAAVQDAVRDGDAPRLRESAHKLCGTISAFSTVAGGVASDLEDCAAQGQLEAGRPLVEQLETMAREILRLLADGPSIEVLRNQVGAAGNLSLPSSQ